MTEMTAGTRPVLRSVRLSRNVNVTALSALTSAEWPQYFNVLEQDKTQETRTLLFGYQTL